MGEREQCETDAESTINITTVPQTSAKPALRPEASSAMMAEQVLKSKELNRTRSTRWHRSARRRLKLPQSRSWYLAQMDCFRSVLLLGKLQSCLPGFCRSQAEFFPFCPRKHFCPARHVYTRRARGPSRRSILSFSPSAFCLIYVFFPLSFVCFFLSFSFLFRCSLFQCGGRW